jgi:hypothetical protein
MDRKRAAMVTSAGVGLLVSALFLRRIVSKRRPEDSREEGGKAVVQDDGHISHRNNRRHAGEVS